MSCDTNGPIRKAYCHDDVTKNPKRLVPSVMRACRSARVKKGFLEGFLISKKRFSE